MLEKKVLIVVDYQEDFVKGTLPVPGADKLEDGIAKRIQKAYDDGDKVIFLKDTHPTSYLKTLEGKNLPIAHCVHGTEGHKLYGKVAGLEGKSGSTTVEKLQFGYTDLPKLLDTQQVKPSEFTLIGVATDICVISNALIVKAQFREVPVLIESALCAGITKEKHDAALEVAKSCQIKVL